MSTENIVTQIAEIKMSNIGEDELRFLKNKGNEVMDLMQDMDIGQIAATMVLILIAYDDAMKHIIAAENREEKEFTSKEEREIILDMLERQDPKKN